MGIRETQGILALEKDLGLHPALKGLKGLYDQGHVAVLNSVANPNSDFGKSLKTTAELIASGVESRVYYLALSGFDTHVRQQQQRLLTDLPGRRTGRARGPLAAEQPMKRHAGAGLLRV